MYPFTLVATMLNRDQEIIPCAKHSKLIKEYHYAGIQELLEKPLSKKEQHALEAEQKKPIIQEEHTFKQRKEIALKEHFKDTEDVTSRNNAILKALDDGYTQGEVARYLGLSTAMISKVYRGVK